MNSSNDTIRPNIVENPGFFMNHDTLIISWSVPQVAEDMDSASFYRVNINNTEDFFVAEKELIYQMTSSVIYNVKIYSYDDCGNQSDTFAIIDNIGPYISGF